MSCLRAWLWEFLEARLLLSAAAAAAADTRTLGAYHTYATLTTDVQAYAAVYPAITQLISIGKSVQNRDIWAIKITDNPAVEEDEPELRYSGSMHGDEPVGIEMSFYFIDHLLTGYGTDTRATNLVNNTEIWVIPNMNPDGLSLNSRYNANGFDLNRNFPEFTVSNYGNIFDGPPPVYTGRQPETVAMMQFSLAHSFSLSANFHTGAVVANNPYDTNGNGFPDYAATPDDALFRELALTYSRPNAPMYNSSVFPQGITNGDEWYEVAGGLQDWSYRYTSDNDITVELSNLKKPAASTLPTLWNDNRESMLDYAEAAQWGIRGIVSDAATGQPVFAKVSVAGNSHPVYSDPDVGDYHRLLLGGTYTVTVIAPGYGSRTFSNVVVSAGGVATRLNVALPPDGPPRIAAVFVAGSNWTPAFKNFLATSGAGDAAYGYRILANDQTNELPWTSLSRISIRFSENVVVSPDDLKVNGVRVASYTPRPGQATFSYNPLTYTATWTASAIVIANEKLLFTLESNPLTGVRDSDGNALDGEWTNPTPPAVSADSFPSGNGVAGGDFAFRINILGGDVNRSGIVQSDDVNLITAAQGATPGSAAYSILKDLDGSATIDVNDLSLVNQKLGQSLPAGEPMATRSSTPDTVLPTTRFAGRGPTAASSPALAPLRMVLSARTSARLTDDLV